MAKQNVRIVLCCPFFDENLIASIHVQEAANWVDEIHIVEANRTFQYHPKPFVFNVNHPKVRYHAVDVTRLFKERRKWFPYLDLQRRTSRRGFFFNASWYNEMIQRNLACGLAGIQDDDIVVLSDIDEIIDCREADWLVSEVLKRHILTVRLRFTMFYFNLVSKNWGGPPDYSYRTFVLTGKKLREDWGFDSDRLRKQGEHGDLCDTVYCLPGCAGYHHSWLGDADFVSRKLAAYAHVEHNRLNSKEYIRECIKSKRSIFPGQDLYVDNTTLLLQSVEKSRSELSKYFV